MFQLMADWNTAETFGRMENTDTADDFERMVYPDTDDTFQNWKTDATIVFQKIDNIWRDTGKSKMKTRLNLGC